MVKLKSGHVYKIWHYDSSCFDRRYIICSPISDLEIQEGEWAVLQCYFLVNFVGKIRILGQGTDLYSLATRFDKLCVLRTLNKRDWEDVNRACIQGGFKYNRKLGKLVGVKYAEEGTSI